MGNVADPDWIKGAVEGLRKLLDGGASDDELDRFVTACRAGDVETTQALLSGAVFKVRLTDAYKDKTGTEAAVWRLRVAALRPVVNQLSARDLHRFIRFVVHASSALVQTHPDEWLWSTHAAVEAAASCLRQAALESFTHDP